MEVVKVERLVEVRLGGEVHPDRAEAKKEAEYVEKDAKEDGEEDEGMEMRIYHLFGVLRKSTNNHLYIPSHYNRYHCMRMVVAEVVEKAVAEDSEVRERGRSRGLW